MSFDQTNLNLWGQSYEKKNFILGDSNTFAYTSLLHFNDQIVLSGPAFSGKKHILFEISKQREIEFFFTKDAADRQIIDIYDSLKKNINKPFVWVKHNGVFSSDVESRLNSLIQVRILELSYDMFESFLQERVSSLGFRLKEECLKYLVPRLNISYYSVQILIDFLLKKNKCSMGVLQEFFEKYSK